MYFSTLTEPTMSSTIRKVRVKLLFFISKHKLIFSILGVFILLSILLYLIWNLTENGSISAIKTAYKNESLVYNCCTPLNNAIRTNIFFLKIHKTGSSTVQSVILRFAMINTLDVMCIKYESYYWPLSDNSLVANARTPNNKYHIFAHHMRYDSKLKSYQYPGTSMVTLLRHPATLFQSAYFFFRMNETTGMTFEQFLKAPVKPEKITGFSDFYAYRGYNQMSADLGFDMSRAKNATAIDEFIEKIDREFDLVMIAEYMDASLVLLANLMGWPLKYVVYVDLNVRPSESNPYEMTEEDITTLMDLNSVDTQLYQHFLKKFQNCMRQYGEDKLNNQTDQLRSMNKEFQKRCVADEYVGGLYLGHLKAIEYKPKNPFDTECVYSIQLTPPLSYVAAEQQAKRLKRTWFL